MGTTAHTSNNLAWTLALLIVIGITGGFYWNDKRALMDQHDQAELRADSLLSVKFQLEGDIRTLKSGLETAADDKAYLTKRINTLHGELNQRDRAVRVLRQERVGQQRSTRLTNQYRTALISERDSLKAQLEAMRDKIDWQAKENKLLLTQKVELEQKINSLNSRLLAMSPNAAVTGDAFLVEATKANRKLTAKAKKAKTITVSLNVPDEFKLEGMQEVYLSLTSEQHQALLPSLRTVTVSLPDVNEVVPVHATQTVNFARAPQRIVFTVHPATDMKPGVYRASVFTKEAYLGAVAFRLRDSFWFF